MSITCKLANLFMAGVLAIIVMAPVASNAVMDESTSAAVGAFLDHAKPGQSKLFKSSCPPQWVSVDGRQIWYTGKWRVSVDNESDHDLNMFKSIWSPFHSSSESIQLQMDAYSALLAVCPSAIDFPDAD